MNSHARLYGGLTAFFGSARLSSALTITAISTGVFAFALNRTIGLPGLIACFATLIVFCALSFLAHRNTIEFTGLVPISLMVFLAWACISIFWSQYQWATLGGLASMLGFTFLGLYVALVRDTIQIVRAYGDVLRFTIAASLVIEVFSGILIDTPIPFLSIAGNISELGPISGLVGNRNELGLLAVIGGISFVVEWRTQSVTRGTAIASIAGAALTLALTGSPIAWGTALVAVSATAILYGVRRLAPVRRRFWQVAILAGAAAAAAIAWSFRGPIVGALNGTGELEYRLNLWQRISDLIQLHPVEGWGWIGQWNPHLAPFTLFPTSIARPSTSAVNAYLDVWFQLGIVGLVAFVGVLGLAFVRSWMLAARQRSVVYTWPAVVLAALLVASLAESSILIEFGWLTFVVCCVKASQKLSWRKAFERPLEQEPLS
ncbi:O-antigen ligase family protein [Salinibacterium hongtaonis]|uniref:O-antigen ligase family protein n=1 Tax=Homoserinimonas hongtaonis TaxID=2079791 RepID=UPI000D3BB67A|nr:O-antigen ligase family protein [Salinibacterium hongtaonis]AWB88651.1 exopolysaccharide biosynthesis protein [Salinibacterium hongtaonis]